MELVQKSELCALFSPGAQWYRDTWRTKIAQLSRMASSVQQHPRGEGICKSRTQPTAAARREHEAVVQYEARSAHSRAVGTAVTLLNLFTFFVPLCNAD